MMRLTTITFALFVLLAPATLWGQDQGVLSSNWFEVSWQPGVLPSTIEGLVDNTSPFHAIDVRLQIEGLDAANHRVGVRLVWASDSIAPGGRTSYFTETIPGAVNYRVTVASFELVSEGDVVVDDESGSDDSTDQRLKFCSSVDAGVACAVCGGSAN